MRRSPEEVLRILREDYGIEPGAHVSWQPISHLPKRYGCVLSVDGDTGNARVQAANGQHVIAGVALTVEPDVGNVILADLHSTYGIPGTPGARWSNQQE